MEPIHTDLTGNRYGSLVVIGPTNERYRGSIIWLCRCNCGEETSSITHKLKSGIKHRCQKCATVATRRVTHGQTGTPEYRAWRAMTHRCTNPNNKNYKHYGGRGIAVCGSWGSFEQFYADMGVRPSPKHSLDRIDPCADYSPTNCRWADKATQARNRRCARLITHDGETLNLSAWAERAGITPTMLSRRLRKGLNMDDALASPPKEQNMKLEIDLNGVRELQAAYRALPKAQVDPGEHAAIEADLKKQIRDKQAELRQFATFRALWSAASPETQILASSAKDYLEPSMLIRWHQKLKSNQSINRGRES